MHSLTTEVALRLHAGDIKMLVSTKIFNRENRLSGHLSSISEAKAEFCGRKSLISSRLAVSVAQTHLLLHFNLHPNYECSFASIWRRSRLPLKIDSSYSDSVLPHVLFLGLCDNCLFISATPQPFRHLRTSLTTSHKMKKIP